MKTSTLAATALAQTEYETLRQRALFEDLGAVYEKMSAPEELAARFGLAFPGRAAEDS